MALMGQTNAQSALDFSLSSGGQWELKCKLNQGRPFAELRGANARQANKSVNGSNRKREREREAER